MKPVNVKSAACRPYLSAVSVLKSGRAFYIALKKSISFSNSTYIGHFFFKFNDINYKQLFYTDFNDLFPYFGGGSSLFIAMSMTLRMDRIMNSKRIFRKLDDYWKAGIHYQKLTFHHFVIEFNY